MVNKVYELHELHEELDESTFSQRGRGQKRSKRSKRLKDQNCRSHLLPTVASAVEDIIRRKYDKACWTYLDIPEHT